MLRDLEVEVLIIDENVQQHYNDLIIKEKDRILFVGVSSIIGSQILGGIRFARFIKDTNPAIPVLWGGWHATILPEQTLKEAFIDYVITGQAETPFRAFTEALLNATDVRLTPNLCYKNQNDIIINPPAGFCDFNDYPPVNYELVDINNYIYYPSFAKKSIVYFASHGCPYHCNFCAMATYYRQKWIPVQIETIVRDLKYFKEKAGIDSVFFQDDNFFTNKEFSLKLCRAFIDEKLDLQWETWTHAGGFLKMFADDDIELLYKAGCRQIISGSESGSQQVLDLVNKKLNVEDNLDFVRLLKKHHIVPFFSIMLCFPGNTENELDDTFALIRKARLIDKRLKVYFSFYTPYPGTKLFGMATDNGFVPPQNLAGWATHTFDDFRAPWWNKKHEQQFERFAHFYIPLSNPYNYKNFYRPPAIKFALYIINKLFYPLVYLRFRANCFAFPVEAVLFLRILKWINKISKKDFKLYPF